MRLSDLISNIPYVKSFKADTDIEIKTLNIDSRVKTDRGLFFCIKGGSFDSHSFAKQAFDNGNIAFVVEEYLEGFDYPQVLVESSRAAMARMAAKFYGMPHLGMKLIGITGTKGKTTSTYLIKAILDAAGYKTGLIGTMGNLIGNEHYDSRLTTPDPIDLYQTLAMMKSEGVEAVVMEVSAHALDMLRLDGLEFEVGCYTNFSQDHLDYFGDMDTYFAAKKKFFTNGQIKNAVLNADGDRIAEITKDIASPFITYGIGARADVYARNIEVKENGASFNIHLGGVDNFDLDMKLTGTFNVYNALCAASVGMVMGIDYDSIKKGLESVSSVPGRIELLDTNTNFKLILDYSHSPDSLENILHTVREFTKNRLIILFGCGGDRDHSKRPIMGEIAGKLADFTIITSDNPRREDPMQIIESIVEGIDKVTKNYIIIEDRKEAIKHALTMADEGDIVILAGKGHETYQERMGVKYPFDEKHIVKEILNDLMYRG